MKRRNILPDKQAVSMDGAFSIPASWIDQDFAVEETAKALDAKKEKPPRFSIQRGGEGSGYHDPHFGRPGERGGSTPRKGGTIKQPIKAIKKGLFHYHQADEIWGGQENITQEQAIRFFKDMGFDESQAKVHANAMDSVWEAGNLRFVSPHEVTAYAAGLFQKRIRDEFKGEWSPAPPIYRPKEGAEIQFGLDNREQSVIDSLLEVEAQIYDLDIENAFVILPDTGEIVFKKTGTVDMVEFTSGEAGKAKNAILCHNHPSGKPPSQEDFMFALDSGMAEIHAYSDETGRHILRFNTDLTAGERARLRNAYTAAYRDQKVITDEKWLNKEYNNWEAWTALSAGTLERVEHGWPDWFDYTHEPSPLQKQ